MARTATPPVLEIAGLVKHYHGLRPLRLASLSLGPTGRLAVAGLDAQAAELLVNLITGASLPDTGQIRAFGRPTAEIDEADEWLHSLDRFGVVTTRAVLVESLSAEQNLAVPFTLDLDPISPVVTQAVRALAAEVGLSREVLGRPVGALTGDQRLRLHLARALAPEPSVLLMEHPTATLAPGEVPAFSTTVAAVVGSRRLALVAITEDRRFARAVGARLLRLRAATGTLVPDGAWWRRS
jgi:ABC-type lipoprotein export system ATPase subunit